MYPPTPTPFPDMALYSPVEIPQMSLWNFAPDAIQTWNSASQVTDLFSLIIVMGILIGGTFLIIRMIRTLTDANND